MMDYLMKVKTRLGDRYYDADTDDDGLSDYDEVMIHGTNPASDSDTDGLNDYKKYSTMPLTLGFR